MPYNTRRKSLSLPSLGIQLPNGSRNREKTATTAGEQPPQKRFKRVHPVPVLGTTTPPPSPPPEGGVSYSRVNDEVVSRVIDVLERSGNRPHTAKELAAILAPTLNIVETYVPPCHDSIYLSHSDRKPQFCKPSCDNFIAVEFISKAEFHTIEPLSVGQRARH